MHLFLNILSFQFSLQFLSIPKNGKNIFKTKNKIIDLLFSYFEVINVHLNPSLRIFESVINLLNFNFVILYFILNHLFKLI